MNKYLRWVKRADRLVCSGCATKEIEFKNWLCTACDNTHPNCEEIKSYLEQYFLNEG